MENFKIKSLIDSFSRAAKNQYLASINGDWKTANKEISTLRQVFNKICKINEPARKKLLTLTESDDLAVASMAAFYSLKYDPDKSISILKKIAEEPGLIGFQATQAIQRWNEGKWDLEK